MKTYVAGFLFDVKREEVALVIKKKPDWQKGKANGIGGKVEPTDKSIHHAMEREFKEETGVSIPHSDWDNYATIKGEDYICHFFRAFDNVIAYVETTEEEITTINVDALDTLSHIPNLRWLIPLALDKTIKSAVIIDGGN